MSKDNGAQSDMEKWEQAMDHIGDANEMVDLDGIERMAKAGDGRAQGGEVSTQPQHEFPCTECGGDATLAYAASRFSDWGCKVKIGERICTACFQKRGGTRIL